MTAPQHTRDTAPAGDGNSNPALDLIAPLGAALSTAAELPLRPQDAALLEGAEPFRFGPDASRQAWSLGQGPVAVLVHGYSGRGVQMAPLARHLADRGFRCVFFDAGGHGASRPERIGFHTFINDTRDLIAHLDTPVQAMIGHSAGGLAMMRARALYGLSAATYAVISAPIFPYVPLETMRAKGAPEAAIEYFKAILSDQFQMSWSALAGGQAFAPEPGKPLLAVYDNADTKVRPADADALAAIWPGARVVRTDGYGHNRILRAEATLTAVAASLGAG